MISTKHRETRFSSPRKDENDIRVRLLAVDNVENIPNKLVPISEIFGMLTSKTPNAVAVISIDSKVFEIRIKKLKV